MHAFCTNYARITQIVSVLPILRIAWSLRLKPLDQIGLTETAMTGQGCVWLTSDSPPACPLHDVWNIVPPLSMPGDRVNKETKAASLFQEPKQSTRLQNSFHCKHCHSVHFRSSQCAFIKSASIYKFRTLKPATLKGPPDMIVLLFTIICQAVDNFTMTSKFGDLQMNPRGRRETGNARAPITMLKSLGYIYEWNIDLNKNLFNLWPQKFWLIVYYSLLPSFLCKSCGR